MRLTSKLVKGIGWTGASQLIRFFLQFGVTAILARLLGPKDFGLIAMVVVFTNFIGLFCDLGLTSALIQRKRLSQEHLSAVFWVNILVGFLLTIILIALAPVIASFFREERLTFLTIAFSLTFFISSFNIVPSALFTKELKFKPLSIFSVLTVVISGIVAIILALAGFGVWSLVGQQIISTFVMLALLWTFSSWRPRFLFKWNQARDLLGYGLNLTGFKFADYFNRNLDDFLIAKFLGVAPLGYYDLAYRFLRLPLNNISYVVGRVLFPSLSAIQDSKKKVCEFYLKANRYIATITFPLMVALSITAPQLVRVFLGHQWGRSIFLIQILAISGLLQSIGATVGWIYRSQGRTDIMFRWGLFSVIVYACAFILGLRWNVEGVAVTYALAGLFLTYPNFAIPFKLINLKFSHFVKQLSSIFLATIVMGGVMFGIRLFFESTVGASDWLILITTALFGFVVYLFVLLLLDRRLYVKDLRRLKLIIFSIKSSE